MIAARLQAESGWVAIVRMPGPPTRLGAFPCRRVDVDGWGMRLDGTLCPLDIGDREIGDVVGCIAPGETLETARARWMVEKRQRRAQQMVSELASELEGLG